MTGLPPLPAERLAEPTTRDISDRLAADAKAYRARVDGYQGPVDDQLEHELSMLRRAINDLI